MLKNKSILITGHVNPDGDALGSSLALFLALRSKHNVQVIVPNEFPYYLHWMPSAKNVIVYENDIINSNLLLDNTVEIKVASIKLAPLKLAPFNLASVKFAPSKLAKSRLAI